MVAIAAARGEAASSGAELELLRADARVVALDRQPPMLGDPALAACQGADASCVTLCA
jgi:hypothetical protein